MKGLKLFHSHKRMKVHRSILNLPLPLFKTSLASSSFSLSLRCLHRSTHFLKGKAIRRRVALTKFAIVTEASLEQTNKQTKKWINQMLKSSSKSKSISIRMTHFPYTPYLLSGEWNNILLIPFRDFSSKYKNPSKGLDCATYKYLIYIHWNDRPVYTYTAAVMVRLQTRTHHAKWAVTYSCWTAEPRWS